MAKEIKFIYQPTPGKETNETDVKSVHLILATFLVKKALEKAATSK
ncbi:hypothetical protein [Peribacillus kribbensis]|nr:hypothetical protein [Peribacillus kribbensis]